MSNVHLGAQAAKRATWRDTDTRPLLQRLARENPNASDSKLFELFWAEIEDEKDCLRSITLYWFDLALLALRRPTRLSKPRQRDVAQIASVKNAIKERLDHEVQIKLLQLVMPNGKSLGECTGAECRSFGGWFVALAKIVPAKKTVAASLSEQQVYQLWQKRR